MQKSDFNFILPDELIAQEPAQPRDSCRMLCVNRESGQLIHSVFSQLPDMLQKDDVLVVNTSRVLPARLIGHKQGLSGVCELLLLRETDTHDQWECLARPGRKIKPSHTLLFGDGSLQADVVQTLDNGNKIVKFSYDTKTLFEKLDAFGRMPLPPYITSQITTNNDYQTVYAKQPGSAAAPTAGLHFTQPLLQQLQNKGIEIAELTLHVGLGTFRPVQVEQIEEHAMHSEWYSLQQDQAQKITDARKKGGRVIAVGTTSCRTLETITRRHGGIYASSGETDIFLRPGSEFLAVDGLITNFHLPESTLIMLVSAFCGYQHTMDAYMAAVDMKYRFYSFGDSMFII